ncbi:MAG: response regulator [Methylovirgula sp.]|uniref:adenylate/guanylate cyclase domain-containing protein n=1 Tax=Methylovirgula sp. TaxID=1978224 RepID=UPI0030767ADD
MRNRPCILAVDDVFENLEIVTLRLEANGYEVITAADGIEALEQTRRHQPDMILLDIMMPKLDGISVLKELKADPTLGFIPVLLLTAKADRSDVVAGLEAGADDYLTKPLDQAALIARVRSMLRIKALHDKVQDQARQLAIQAEELAEWNRGLEARVAEQVSEIERISRLKRFLAPQVVDVIALSGDPDALLASHSAEITVLFCDLRGFTAFTEAAEPEQVMTVLSEFHATLGNLIHHYEGTLERFAGDGLLTLFNDPLPCPDHSERAVRLAIDMRAGLQGLSQAWRQRGHELGFGIGIARGMATLGKIGFDRRFDYAAIGSVTNLASRLCDEAKSGQILIDRNAFAATENLFEAERLPLLSLKGFGRQIEAFAILRERTD